MATSYDNRETCGLIVPSSCSPYTGYIPESAQDDIQCKPNVNDIIKNIYDQLEDLKNFVDISDVDFDCLDESIETLSQAFQQIVNKICQESSSPELQNVEDYAFPIDLSGIQVPACESKPSYTIEEIFLNILSSIDNMQQEITNIKTILNI